MTARSLAMDDGVDEPRAESAEPTASSVLRTLAAGEGRTVSFGDVLAATGARVHGFALLVLVLPETLPLPLPSASAVLAVPLMLISLHLALFGEQSRRWSERFRGYHVSRAAVAAAVGYVVPALEWLESLSRPRWPALARRESLIGVVCFFLSFILFLPIPLLNALPAICLALLALGLIQRDGILIALGLAGAAAIAGALFWALIWAADLRSAAGFVT